VGVVSTRNGGGRTSGRRGRWFSGQWGSFRRETRAVGHRHDVVGGGGHFNAKWGRWDVGATWQVGEWAVVVVVTWQMGGWPVGVVSMRSEGGRTSARRGRCADVRSSS